MKKASILVGALAATLMLTGCQESKVEEKVEAEVKTEVAEKKKETSEETKAPTMSKEEVTKLINSTIDKIESALDKAWEENNWTSSSEADLNIFKEKLKDVTSEEFVDTQIKYMMEHRYYEGTDIRYYPYGLMTDLRLDIQQEENRLVVKSFTPENLINGGANYTITFDYIDNKWILKGWTEETITNLGLTTEESKQVIKSALGYSDITFKEEKQTDTGTVFVFSLGEAALLTFNPNTTEFTEEFPEVKEEEETTEAVSYENVNYEELDEKAEEIVNGFKTEDGTSPGTTPFYYAGVLYELQDYFMNLEGNNAKYEEWHIKYPYAKAEYILIDSVLNGVWNILSEKLDASEFETLKAEQKEWIKEKDADAQKSLNSEDEELIGKVRYYYSLHTSTIIRCEELIDMYYSYLPGY